MPSVLSKIDMRLYQPWRPFASASANYRQAEILLVMRIALSLYVVQIFNSVGMAWRSHGNSNADMVRKLKGAFQLEHILQKLSCKNVMYFFS